MKGHLTSSACFKKMFPILGGRLLKEFSERTFELGRKFPILGGRLLKLRMVCRTTGRRKFPILGGRLLKMELKPFNRLLLLVSNPWREAIEVY